MSTVVITRPAHQAAPLVELIHDLGVKTLLFPALEILPATDERDLIAATQHLAEYAIAIFVSANAVQYALPRCPQPFPDVQVIAIGPGTARALQTYHLYNYWLPQSHHSEGLLALPPLQTPAGKKIAIFCGENSRPLLKNSLRERGARVDEIVCYQRRLPDLDPAPVLQQWRAEQVKLIVSTSAEGLANLWQLFGNIDPEWLLHTSLLVISPAMAEQAKQLGFKSIITAGGASDQAICMALASSLPLEGGRNNQEKKKC